MCRNVCPDPAALAAAGTGSKTACTFAWAEQKEALEHRALSHGPSWRIWQPAQPSCTQQEDTDPASAVLVLSGLEPPVYPNAGMGVTFFSGRVEGEGLASKAQTVAEVVQLLCRPANESPQGTTHPASCPLQSQGPTLPAPV